MNSVIQCKTTILPLFIAGVLACFGLLEKAQAVVPPPDGGYPGFNTAEGEDALFSLTGGDRNTAIGYRALYNNRIGVENTATGVNALLSTTGNFNTATGAQALYINNGSYNTATGYQALLSNTSGVFNTANGVHALHDNTTGDSNTATGYQTLFNNINGIHNTANGDSALFGNVSGDSNTANGVSALFGNTSGGFNTAVGEAALQSNRSGSFNTATGVQALNDNVTGFFNTAYGYRALQNVAGSLFNIAVGSQAGLNLIEGGNNIYIGNFGEAREGGTIRIGIQGTHTRAFVAGISGSPITGTSVVVNSNGRLGTAPSSQRFKEAIRPMDKASEAILALKPVTFRYKAEIDPDGVSQFGLIAEEVEKVNPDLVVRDEKGKPYSVRYDAVNTMLLNEFLKEHRTVQEQGATIARLEKQIEALTAGLQKVSAQLEARQPAPQVVANP
jgi:hypothetical protein